MRITLPISSHSKCINIICIYLQFQQSTSFQDCYDPLIGIGPTPHLPFDQICSNITNQPPAPLSNSQGTFTHGSGGPGIDDYNQFSNILNNNSCKGGLKSFYLF